MSKSYYPGGSFSDASAPFNQNDPTESDEFQDKQLEIWNERLSDPEWVLDAFNERTKDDLKLLSKMVIGNETGTYTINIGSMVNNWVKSYCEPTSDEVLEAMEKEKL